MVSRNLYVLVSMLTIGIFLLCPSVRCLRDKKYREGFKGQIKYDSAQPSSGQTGVPLGSQENERSDTSENFKTEQASDKNIQGGLIDEPRKLDYDIKPFLNVSDNLKAKQTEDKSCELEVTEDSIENFSTEILKYKYNFVYFNLSFNGVSISENTDVITYNRWIWTYRGENGGYEYLFLPNEYGYLSFGILWSYTLLKPIPIEIRVKRGRYCSHLTGGGDADQKIGDALGNMTKRIASLNYIYNSSYWCYTRRMYIESDIIFVACENTVCTIQTIEYNCCKYTFDYPRRNRFVECDKEHYHFGVVWWLVPILIGNVLWAYYPLLLISIGCRISSFSRRRKRIIIQLEEMNNVDECDECKFIRLSKHKSPVTFLSTIFEPLSKCKTEGKVLSRMIRIIIVLLPLSLTMIRTLLDYEFNGDFVKAAVQKGALIGFSTVFVNLQSANHYFLRFLGGPFVALPIFIVFGCLLIILPSNLEETLERGLIEFSGKSTLLLTLSAESKAKLAGMQIANTTGYKRIHKILLCQVLLLLNGIFWKQTFKLFFKRFTRLVLPMLRTVTHSSCVAVVIGFFVAILYIVVSFIELIFTCFYFAFPVISCFFIFIKAYIKSAQGFFNLRIGMKRMLGHFLTIILILIFACTWYMYCLIFFDAFWFLTKIVMFTYTGVIAFPKLSYGYLILTSMALFYIVEGFNSFSQNYQDLLVLSIKACKKLEAQLPDEQKNTRLLSGDGLSMDLWHLIVQRHRPRRIQVTYTLSQLFAVISILSISLNLLWTFDKLRTLSLISHVFIALFICALPKIAKSMCTSGIRYRRQKKMIVKIKRTILDYINNEIDTGVYDIYDFHGGMEYEELS